MDTYKITEAQLNRLILNEVKTILNEISYDDWKLMTPEEDAGLSEYDVDITIRVAVDGNELENWSDCEKKHMEEDGDGGYIFETTFESSIWVGRYDNPEDERERCEECAYNFVKEHGDAAGGYEVIDYKIK